MYFYCVFFPIYPKLMLTKYQDLAFHIKRDFRISVCMQEILESLGFVKGHMD